MTVIATSDACAPRPDLGSRGAGDMTGWCGWPHWGLPRCFLGCTEGTQFTFGLKDCLPAQSGRTAPGVRWTVIK